VACDWLLVDGSSLIFRAFYGVPASVRSPDGRPVNAVRGFLDALSRLVISRQPRRLAIASDEDWRPQWRVELIPSYKAHRTAEPMPPGLIPQMPIIQEMLDAIGVDFIGLKDYEAEDVIASWAAKASGSIEIASGDRDLFALIEDPRVSVLYPEKSGLVQVTEAEVTRRYGVPGRKYADFAILRGDPSDGLPGLKGVGAVAAASLIRKHGGVAGILSDGALSDAAREYLARALRVVPPVATLPMALPQGRRASYPAHPDRLAALSETHGLTAAGDRLVAVLSTGGAEPVVDP
jgi:5'-3' exonuclease